ncbi:MAG: MoaD/ThiS family protein [Bacteroidota bacterium]
MNIKLMYFGMLAEVTGCSEENLRTEATHIAELKEILLEKYPELQSKDFRIAQDEELVSGEVVLNGSQIALLPPFSGG